MREIKFRGKTQYEEWAYGNLIKRYGETYIFDISGEMYIDRLRGNFYECRMNLLPIDENTVGQYTGLTDKNGKEIYEGDIVCTKFPSACPHAGQICSIGDVRYEKGCFGAVWTNYKNTGWHSLRRFDDDIIDDIDVIGNIYDNPELLKGDKQ